MSVFTKLRKAQRLTDIYPGCPYTETLIIKTKTKQVYSIWYEKPQDLNKFIQELQSRAFYMGIGAEELTKGSFIIDSKMPNYKDIKSIPNNDFYFEDYEIIKYVLAISSAYREYKDKDAYIFAYYNGDAEFYEIEVFNADEEEKASQYVSEYFSCE